MNLQSYCYIPDCVIAGSLAKNGNEFGLNNAICERVLETKLDYKCWLVKNQF